MQAETMSPQKRDAFINAFEQLPQRVLWKWEAQNLPRKPKNIMIQQWMPQRDILGKNTKNCILCSHTHMYRYICT